MEKVNSKPSFDGNVIIFNLVEDKISPFFQIFGEDRAMLPHGHDCIFPNKGQFLHNLRMPGEEDCQPTKKINN